MKIGELERQIRIINQKPDVEYIVKKVNKKIKKSGAINDSGSSVK